MALDLYPHNEKAYRAAAEMLGRCGKAAVIQPTGTGKSFVAFKLAEEHPESPIYWLSPSEYIFQTQTEGLIKAGGTLPENVHFLTYTRLMMAEGELEEDDPEPDYIVLDEFHRCGAAEWGRSVEQLLRTYPTAKVLGLSATSVRYLDNQRDMAEELFDGCIAWEMSLGEAIGRGILPSPLYVSALYSYQEELEKLAKRVADRRNVGERKLNEELLERLRRALEHAEGMDVIFSRYMKPTGKYLVFCSDKEHMDEILERVPEWFSGVDGQAHVYRAYYDNPENDKEFGAFKQDHTGHLKLLFCINMLNEGIHVEDVDGVVLLRPTVSPILYLQQIGRALSAGGAGQPVIFDLVDNFDSLYCVDALREEAEKFYSLLHGTGEAEGDFSESFRILDQVRECRALFEQLRRNLSAPWDIYYQALRQYHEEHGHIRIPKRYVTLEGLSLGSWLQTQRRVRSGNIRGNLTPEQIARLDLLGMIWEDGPASSWNRGYTELVKYREQHGDVDVKARYVTEDGYALGNWVCVQRQKYQRVVEQRQVNQELLEQKPIEQKPEDSRLIGTETGEYASEEDLAVAMQEGKQTRTSVNTLSMEQIQKLEALGMVWSKDPDKWDVYYQLAEEYFRQHGDLHIPWDYESPTGEALGKWLQKQRRLKQQNKLTSKQQEKLETIHIEWDNTYDQIWEEKYALAKKYYQHHGNLDIPVKYCVDGVKLGRWISTVRSKRKHPQATGLRLDEERIRRLDEIGMVW